MTVVTTALDGRESVELAEAESIIERGLKTFVEVGEALARIRDGRLYRATHQTFEDYCRERWTLSADRARQIIAASRVTVEISTHAPGAPLPARESHAKELGGLAPHEAAAVLRLAHGTGRATAHGIREARKEVFPPHPKDWRSTSGKARSQASIVERLLTQISAVPLIVEQIETCEGVEANDALGYIKDAQDCIRALRLLINQLKGISE